MSTLQPQVVEYRGLVYRGTNTPPKIVFNTGFIDHTPSGCVGDYLEVINGTIGVSTSKTFGIAKLFADENKTNTQSRYVYTINCLNGYDIANSAETYKVTSQGLLARLWIRLKTFFSLFMSSENPEIKTGVAVTVSEFTASATVIENSGKPSPSVILSQTKTVDDEPSKLYPSPSTPVEPMAQKAPATPIRETIYDDSNADDRRNIVTADVQKSSWCSFFSGSYGKDYSNREISRVVSSDQQSKSIWSTVFGSGSGG